MKVGPYRDNKFEESVRPIRDLIKDLHRLVAHASEAAVRCMKDDPKNYVEIQAWMQSSEFAANRAQFFREKIDWIAVNQDPFDGEDLCRELGLTEAKDG
jgi:hypothetical protein